MTELQFFNAPVVDLIDHMGTDYSIVQAARVSVQGANDEISDDTMAGKDARVRRDTGLINYLLKNKHGSPFEHTTLKFYVKAPIFVFREFHRHRVGFSYNEMSGRYTQLLPEFYIPAPERPLVNVGTSAAPVMGPADQTTTAVVDSLIHASYEQAWVNYQALLASGIANEVARVVLPVGIMSQMYVTCNARSLMNFLSLRTHHPEAAHVSRPQYEIEQVAKAMEWEFAKLFPITYGAYVANGRVAP